MMMGAAPSAVSSDQLSILRSLARLLDPAAGPELARLAANLRRQDVAHAERLTTTLPCSDDSPIADPAGIERREVRTSRRREVSDSNSQAVRAAITHERAEI
jgi:hypothetical protein